MLKAIIIEDIEQHIDALKSKLQQIQQPIKIVGTATTLREGRQLIFSQRPDVVFLDIGFEEERSNAFEMLHKIQEEEGSIRFHIIFITGQGNYDNKMKALKVSDCKMLHKPYLTEDLTEAIEDLLQKRDLEYSQKKLNTALNIIMRGIQNGDTMIELLNDFSEKVFIRDIVMIEVNGKNSDITLIDKRVLHSTNNVSHYENRLESCNFFRVHDKRLINEYYFRKFLTNNNIELTNGKIVECSSRGFNRLKEKKKTNPNNFPNYEGSNFAEILSSFLKLGRK